MRLEDGMFLELVECNALKIRSFFVCLPNRQTFTHIFFTIFSRLRRTLDLFRSVKTNKSQAVRLWEQNQPNQQQLMQQR